MHCPACSSLADKLAERETKPAKSEAERDEAVAKLAELDAEKLSLERRVDELEHGTSRNNFNSGKPPASERLAKPAADQIRTRRLRRKSNRQSGGQPGHPGATPIPFGNPD